MNAAYYSRQVGRLATLLAALVVTAIVSGCVQGAPPIGAPTPTPGPTATLAPTNTPTPPLAAVLARQALAARLQLTEEEVRLVSFERVEWPNACLGVVRSGESCAQVITRGFRIVLEAGADRYVFHTNESGGAARLVQSPMPLQAASIAWELTDAVGCRQARIENTRVYYGACGGEMLESNLMADLGRETQLAEMVSAFAAFQADTPAGKVNFAGKGTRQAEPVEQRMVAEWAALVAREAETGRGGAPWGLALTWHREGGIAGFCDDLSVYVSGWSSASHCGGTVPSDLGWRRLAAADVTELYAWVDTLKAFTAEQNDGGVADGMTIRLALTGRGSNEPSPADRLRMADFASRMFAQWAKGVTTVAEETAPAPTLAPTLVPVDTVTPMPAATSTAPAATTPTSSLTPPAMTPDEVDIYAAIIRQVYTVDHTFGAPPLFPVTYLARFDDLGSGSDLLTGVPAALSAKDQETINAALSDLPARFIWVTDVKEVPRNEFGAVTGHGALISMGMIRRQADGKVQVAASIYIGMLAAGGQTYVLQQVDGVWTIVGTTGMSWIS